MRLSLSNVLPSLALALALTSGFSSPAHAAACSGDCDGDGSVTVDEIVRGVNIALGTQSTATCGSFDTNGDNAVTVEEIIAAVISALDGCSNTGEQAFVVVTNFTTGSFGTISTDPPRAAVPGSSARQVHPDAIARSFGDTIYVVNRFMGDNIQRIDPANNYATIDRCSTGDLTNPHDIAFASADKAYVSLYDKARILVVDPTPEANCGGFVLSSIDLTAYADADGLPEVDLMTVVGDHLFVTLQRLDRENFFVPSGAGRVLEIDMATDTVSREIVLAAGNPFSQTNGIVVRNGELLIGEVGEFGKTDGGVERIDIATGTSRGFVVTEASAGGDITDFAIASGSLGYVLISLPDFSNRIVRFDPSTGAVGETLVGGGNFSDIEINARGELWVAQTTAGSAGIRVFDAGSGLERTTMPIDLALPPFAILFHSPAS